MIRQELRHIEYVLQYIGCSRLSLANFGILKNQLLISYSQNLTGGRGMFYDDGDNNKRMNSLSTIGKILIATSLFAMVVPLICWSIQFLVSVLSISYDKEPSSSSYFITMISNIGKQIPRIAACTFTAYIGICIGYVGLVNVGLLNPDKRIEEHQKIT